jgi:hypothetical protein
MDTNKTENCSFLGILGKVALCGFFGFVRGATIGFVIGAALAYFIYGGKENCLGGGMLTAFLGGTFCAKAAFQTFKLK